jgi:nicotinamidase-related amidase
MSDFLQRLKKAFTFFEPDNLARQPVKYEGEVALLVIDVQEKFCKPRGIFGRGNSETKEISKRIKSIVPEFRKAGIPVYAIYFGDEEKKASQIDFYEFAPHPDDVLVAKNDDSAFQGSNIREILKNDKRKLLLTCGFNLNACVKSTVMDALDEGFDVCLLKDLAGNDNENDASGAEEHLTDMRDKGVTIEESGKILELIRTQKIGGLT